MIADSDVVEPLNLGSSELVTINDLVTIVEQIAGVRLKRSYRLDAPKGVNGRNSDNTRIVRLLGWEPSVRLRDGLEKTYRWIYDEYMAKYASAPARVTRPSRNGKAKPKRKAGVTPGRKKVAKRRAAGSRR